MGSVPQPPFAAGSVSLRLYAHSDLPADRIIAMKRAQAALAVKSGFDGVMMGEHHNGFPGYMPNPAQVAGWLLEAMPTGWAAACPLLLPLRPTAQIIEETAWLAARFPGRVGIGVASGSLESDFTIMGLNKDDLTRRFAEGFAQLTGALSGRDPGSLENDPAVRRCAEHPIPVLSAAMSKTACRRAASLGAGLLFESLSPTARCRELVDIYREAGGIGPIALVRRVWVGEGSWERQDKQVGVYRTYADPAAQAHWQEGQLITGRPEIVAEGLAAAVAAVGADALNLRIQVPGMSPDEVNGQIEALAEVLSILKPRLNAPRP
jgi:alkanesulfonate monooxygenase SsuD/methylene tetrahydromethanopterin reductase-like flavin-dependent oxidoreductase (luciferase family)